MSNSAPAHDHTSHTHPNHTPTALRFRLYTVCVESMETTCLRKGLEVHACVAQGSKPALDSIRRGPALWLVSFLGGTTKYTCHPLQEEMMPCFRLAFCENYCFGYYLQSNEKEIVKINKNDLKAQLVW